MCSEASTTKSCTCLWYVYVLVVPYCPAVTPPLPFATYLQEKEGGGRNNEDLHFRLAVKPPPPRIRVLRSTKLCCEAEDESSFDRRAVAVLKATYVAIFWQVVSQPDSSHRPRRQDDGLRKPSEISEKGQDQFSNYFLHA